MTTTSPREWTYQINGFQNLDAGPQGSWPDANCAFRQARLVCGGSAIWCQRAVKPGEGHQRRTADRLKAKWFEFDTGNCPVLSMPDELTALLTA